MSVLEQPPYDTTDPPTEQKYAQGPGLLGHVGGQALYAFGYTYIIVYIYIYENTNVYTPSVADPFSHFTENQLYATSGLQAPSSLDLWITLRQYRN